MKLILRNNNGLLGYLLLLTGFFIFLEISLFIQNNSMYLGEFKVVADRIHIPFKIIPELFRFVLIQFILHFMYALFIWFTTLFIGIALSASRNTLDKIGIGLWMVGIITILLANECFFPNSIFASLLKFVIPVFFAKLLLIILLGIFLVGVALAFYGLTLLVPKTTIVISAILITTALILFFYPAKQVILDGANAEKPNIIFIGIDSLRPDFLGFFGYEKQTPALDKFLNQATVFSDAFTPLARTFPAWISILTGQYPKQSGIRFNLPKIKQFNWQNTLPNILRRQGYTTIFATDETRFSNIDESFGFDKTITPPIGVNDFLLGNLNDFPFSNLLVNTPIGEYLFPHSYGNRPVFMTYNPDSFLKMLKPTLTQTRKKPLFFAVHLCLPHFPYFWGTDLADSESINNYRSSIHRVDQQFAGLIQLLQQSHLLEHSIVVVLSDHGEAVELPGDRVTDSELFISGSNNKKNSIPHFYPPSFDFETVNQSAGHGTDVLGLSQYHILLAFRTYGLVKNEILVNDQPISLLDIKPTVLDFLHDSNDKSAGESFKNQILGEKSTPRNQDFFIESDFSPQAIRSVHPETSKLLLQGVDYFKIDPATGRVIVKDNMAKLIISSKQYADIYGSWILALYPQNKTTMMPILVNLRTGQWTNDLNVPFAQSSPAKHMLQALKSFYGDEITTVAATF